MIFEIEVAINYFEILSKQPYAWQLLVSSDLGVVKGDTLKLIEIDSSKVPTGNTRVGIVRFVELGEILFNNGENVLAYCYNVERPIESSIIGDSLIVG